MKPLTLQEIQTKLQNLNGWKLKDNTIHKTLVFTNFKEAFAMMTRIAFEAEAQGHHTDWSNVYKTVSISLSTHDAGGITDKEFSLATAIDKLIQE